MSQYNIHQLRDFLNYDTYTEKVLMWEERIKVHKAIAYQTEAQLYTYDFEPELTQKLKEIYLKTKTNWTRTEVKAYEDDNGIKKIKILKI